jgi:hypothetical protein
MEKEFVNGLIAKAPHEKAPEFVKGRLSIKRAELIEWLSGKQDEWINLDIKVGKSGKWYAQVNDWKPEQAQTPQPAQSAPAWPPQQFVPPAPIPRQQPDHQSPINLEDIPF